MSYEHVIRAAARLPWAILPEKLDEIVAFLELKANGGQVAEEVADAYAASRKPAPERAGGIAVIPMYGVIGQRMNLMNAMSGGTSIEKLTADFRDALADSQVGAIVFDVDSPGGSVFGVEELATEIREARGSKPIVAVANSLMASAAYWLGSQADELVVTPSGQVGSVGVLAMHVDQSAMNEKLGIRPTVISAGKYKAEGSPDAPLSEEARDYMQARVNDYYDTFVGAVAAGRRTGREVIRSGYGEGRVVLARQAVRQGMADRVGTLDATIERLLTPQGRSAVLRQRAEAEAESPLVAEETITDIRTLTKREAERALRDAGASRDWAKALLSRGWEPEARDVPEEETQTGPSIDLLLKELDLLAATL
jgi:capsid assembly protease